MPAQINYGDLRRSSYAVGPALDDFGIVELGFGRLQNSADFSPSRSSRLRSMAIRPEFAAERHLMHGMGASLT